MRQALLTLMIIAMPASAGTGSVHRHTKKASPTSGPVHVVRRGETAGRIAASEGLSLRELQSLNPGRNLAKLSIGTRLVIGKAPARTATLPSSPSAAPAPARTAVLAKGETLYGLAKTHGVTLTELLAANPGLNPRRVRTGTLIRIPGAPSNVESKVADPLPPLPALPVAQARLVRDACLLPSDVPGSEPLFPFRPADPDHLDLIWPVETRSISSYWGPRTRTRVVRVKNRRKKHIRYRSLHKGIDLPAPMHTDIYAAMDGVVTYAGKARGYGNVIEVDHGNGVSTVYGHESVTLVHEGDIVQRGQKIAEVGRAGNATGPHLHFELRVNGVQRNPLPVLDDTEEVPGDLTAQNLKDTGPSAP